MCKIWKIDWEVSQSTCCPLPDSLIKKFKQNGGECKQETDENQTKSRHGRRGNEKLSKIR